MVPRRHRQTPHVLLLLLLQGCFAKPGDGSSDNSEYAVAVRAPHAGPIVALLRSPFLEGLLLRWALRQHLEAVLAALCCSRGGGARGRW